MIDALEVWYADLSHLLKLSKIPPVKPVATTTTTSTTTTTTEPPVFVPSNRDPPMILVFNSKWSFAHFYISRLRDYFSYCAFRQLVLNFSTTEENSLLQLSEKYRNKFFVGLSCHESVLSKQAGALGAGN